MKTSQMNGDTSGATAMTGGAGNQAETADTGAATSEVKAETKASAAPGQAPEKRKHEPAFTPPQEEPAIPRDEFHGKGGIYALVDGKRVPCDDAGVPLPAEKAKK